MNKFLSLLWLTALAVTTTTAPRARAADAAPLRAPAVPLVACNPYFNIWSRGTDLAGVNTSHWTGREHRMASLIRIDGHPFRLMGRDPGAVPMLPQTGVEILPTRTIYSFAGGGISLDLTFLTPMLPDDVDLLSRPVTYLIWSAHATDGAKHEVAVYFDVSAELTVEDLRAQVIATQQEVGAGGTQLTQQVIKMGAANQAILGRKGDDLRIDWGYLYAASQPAHDLAAGIADRATAENEWATTGKLPASTAGTEPRSATKTVAAFSLGFPSLAAQPEERWVVLAYDDEYSIQYMKQNLRPFWRRNGDDAAALLRKSFAEFAALRARCAKFDAELMADLTAAGGGKYARLGALAFRTCFAAGVFVADANGQPLQFCKENHSNGCISTSDVFYPMSPQFLLFGPTLAKSFIVPFMEYAASDRWRFPFAPHDLGTYPLANGQVYGDGERGVNNQMPVEESGNLLLLFGAVSQMEGNANFAGKYWKQLTQWAEYLKSKGFDPENQLCTDDFAGHLAHNVNLSAKAIVALGAYGRMCELRGETARAKEYNELAKTFAARWVTEARQGDHFALAFDRPNTWSQKYNLVWDRILGLHLFPDSVLREEMDFYKRTQKTYGLPLDNRKGYTKTDWTLWTATLTQNRADFDAILDPVYRSLNETPDRSPLTDWYETSNAKKVGFTARPVLGGILIQLLYNRELWHKWAARDVTHGANWAAMPLPPKIVPVVATAESAPAEWRHTTIRPAGDWFAPGFNDAAWPQGLAGFGAGDPPGAPIHTPWPTADIWIRRVMEIPGPVENLQLAMYHDEDAEVYINGILAVRASGYSTSYEVFALSAAGQNALKPGKNLVAIHCHQTTGGQFIDAGFVEVIHR